MEVLLSTTLFLFLSTAALLTSSTAGEAFPPTSPTIGGAFPPTSTTIGEAFPPTSGDFDYIRTNCETTRYPETCVTTLSNYSGAIQHDPCRLAMVAIHVALSHAAHMSNYVTNISRQANSGNTTESGAIDDCSSVFEDAVYEIKKSRKEMRRLGWTGESLRFQLSNVQTWMSAALTNEDTCMDGFEGLPDGDTKTEVCDRVAAVMQVTSNALALVNSYADKISA